MSQSRMAGYVFKNENERRLGKKEYNRLSASGLQDPTNKGKYSAAEVIAEMRDGRDGKTTEEMADYYQELADGGTKFNKSAMNFLSDRHGVTFGSGGKKGGNGGGGNDETPTPSPDPTPDPSPTPGPSPSPTPTPEAPPQVPGLTGGISVNFTQNNPQEANFTGRNNTVTQTQDNNVNTYGAYGTAGRAQAMRDKHVNMLKGGLTFTGY